MPAKKVRKVLLICSVYKPLVGGVQTVIEQLCEYYQKRGVETAILTKRFPFNLPDCDTYHQVPVFRFDRPKALAEVPHAMEQILRHEEALRADVVHLIGIRRPMPIIAHKLAQRWKVSYVATLSGGDIPNEGDPESGTLWDEAGGTVEPYVTRADAITVFSQATGDLASAVLSSPHQPQVIYAGLDIDRVKVANPIAPPYPFLFSARRLSYPKGVDLLLAAFAAVTYDYPGVRLVIAGDGDRRAALEEQVKELGIKNKVDFLGEIPLDEVYGLMKTAIAHFCPSRAESGGMVNIEAQAAGCLAVGSRAGGIGEYIRDGVTGLLHEPESVDQLARTIRYILAEENQLTIDLIKAQASADIGSFSWDHCAEEYLQLYAGLV